MEYRDNIDLVLNEPTRFKSLSFRDRSLILLFILFSITIFLIRVPVRTLSLSPDFKIIYVASKAWVNGLNPYDGRILQDVWVSSGESIETAVPLSSVSVYPITALILISPITFIKWDVAKIIWFGINILSFIFLSYRLIRMTNYRWPDIYAILLIPTFLSCTHIQNCFFQGQPVIIVIALITYSIYYIKTNNYFLSALALSVSLCLKPQLSFLFFIYFFVNREWKVIIMCILLFAAVLSLALIRMGFLDFSWLSSYIYAIESSLQKGRTNDPSIFNPGRHSLINMHLFIYNITESKIVVNYIIYTIFLTELLLILILKGNFNYSPDVLLDISAIGLISLMPVYHRNYDAAILLFLITFCFVAIRTNYANYAKAMLIMMSVFVIPGPSILRYLASQYHFFKYISNFWFWKIIMIPHQVIIIFILSVLVIIIMFKRKNEGIRYVY